MWGSSFADLARKAQEAASSTSGFAVNIPTGMSLFNLDSILEQEEHHQGSKRQQDRTSITVSTNDNNNKTDTTTSIEESVQSDILENHNQAIIIPSLETTISHLSTVVQQQSISDEVEPDTWDFTNEVEIQGDDEDDDGQYTPEERVVNDIKEDDPPLTLLSSSPSSFSVNPIQEQKQEKEEEEDDNGTCLQFNHQEPMTREETAMDKILTHPPAEESLIQSDPTVVDTLLSPPQISEITLDDTATTSVLGIHENTVDTPPVSSMDHPEEGDGTMDETQTVLDSITVVLDTLLDVQKDVMFTTTPASPDSVSIPVVEKTREQHPLDWTSSIIPAVMEQEEKEKVHQGRPPVETESLLPTIEAPTQVTTVEPTNVVEISTSSSSSSRSNLQADAIAQAYMLQLKRLETQHELEIQEYHQRISTLENQLVVANKKISSVTSPNPISIHDKCLAQLRKLEREYTTQLEQKEDELMQSQFLVQSMDTELQSLKKNNQVSEDVTTKYNQAMTENEFLKSSLSTATVDLEKYREQYETLKSRAKTVAIELRDRREEVKALGDENKDLRTRVQTWEQSHARLESQLSVQSKIMEERNEEIASMHSRISSMQEDHQKSMQAYKKKAQESISSANARLTALTQAKDVADATLLEAQLQCQRVNQAMIQYQEERDAVILESKQTVSESSMRLLEMKQEIARLMEQMASLEAERIKYLDKSTALEERSKVDQQELGKVRQEYKDMNDKFSALSKELAIEQARSNELLLQIQNDNKTLSGDAKMIERFNEKSRQLLEAQGKITQMEQELATKSAHIDELNAKLYIHQQQDHELDDDYDHEPMHSPRKSQFYFVMEKQAELDTIREEVNRLASLISDAESSKVAALDAMEVMRKRMEEAEARLRRHEKLSGQGESSVLNQSSISAKSESAVNIEYLKNIILNYLHAKTLNERKTLLPVLCAVLELTTDEKANALKSVEESVDIQRVGVSVIENMQNKGIVHGLLGW